MDEYLNISKHFVKNCGVRFLFSSKLFESKLEGKIHKRKNTLRITKEV